MTGYKIFLAVLILLGLLPALYFCVTWSRHVSKFWSWAAWDAGGWVWALTLLYLYSFLGLFISEPSNNDHQLVQGLSSGVLGFGLDIILWMRAIRWFKIQRAFRRVVKKHP